MHQARLQVAGVAKIDRGQILAAFIEGEELEVGSGVIHPSYAFRGRTPATARHNYLQSAEVAAYVAVLTAIVEPQDAEGEDAVHRGGGFRFADGDDRVGGGSFQQPAANIGRAEAVLQVHRRAEAVNFRSDKGPGKSPLQQPLIRASGRVACGGSPAIAGGHQFERLRFGRSHAPRHHAQALRARLHAQHGADDIPFLAPELQNASAMRLADRVARVAHVEDDAAVFEHGGGGMFGQVLFDLPGENVGGDLLVVRFTRDSARNHFPVTSPSGRASR